MRISFNWLQRYIKVLNSPKEIATMLTGVGLEVESIEYIGKKFDNFFVGEVISVEKHPNADRLSVCSVVLELDKPPLIIICGAPNVAAGQKVVVGVPGAIIPKNQHDPGSKPFELIKTQIRGIESSGMICSDFELGLGADKDGIKILENTSVVGTSLTDYLGLNDVAMEIGVTPNRPDCLSHIGIARELSAAIRTLVLYPLSEMKSEKGPSVDSIATVSVENKEACPRYTARVIKNITVKESPDWLKSFLTSAGHRPINNIVDSTNFVMLEYGQPLHAFDYDNLADHAVVIKNSQPKEKFTTLDGKVHTLSGEELMICDGKKSVAIAGVMGGINSEISERTTTVLLESAYFDPVSVRRTAKKLGISTDASYRFERGMDPNIVDVASKRAAMLIAELAGGEVIPGVIDIYTNPIKMKEIFLRVSKVNEILGIDLDGRKIFDLLLLIKIESNLIDKNTLQCTVPTFRPDIVQEIDLIEEVARLYGYDNIPNLSSGEIVYSEPSVLDKVNDSISAWLQANSFHEVVTNSLIDSNNASFFSEKILKVKNPLSTDLEVMRPSLMPTLLQTVSYNFNHGASQIRLFELGSTFESTNEPEEKSFVKGIKEFRKLGVIVSGLSNDNTWFEKQREYDIFDLKGTILSMLTSIGLDNIHLIYYDASSSLTDKTIGIEINGTYAGFIGQCPDKILKKYKIEKNVFFAEFDLDVVTDSITPKKFVEFSKFPTVVRDLAVIVDKKVRVGDIEKTIRESGGDLVIKVSLFDLFEGQVIEKGKKSVAFTIYLNSMVKTLTDSEIDGIISNIVNAMSVEFGATIRKI